MDGLGLPGAQLAHALGCPARGGQQQHRQAHALQQGHNAPGGGGLAGAGAAGQQQHPGPGRQRHGLTLVRGIGNALLAFHLGDDLVHIFPGLPRRIPQGQKPPGHPGLRLIQAQQIAGLDIGHLLLNDDAPGQQTVQGRLQGVGVRADELGGGGQQLVPGQEHMAVVQVVG